MAKQGIAVGARALLLYPPGLDYITAFLGCLYAGVVAVPAYPPDLRRLQRTMPRLRGLIQDSGATVALAEPAIQGLLAAGNALPAEIPAARWLSTSALAADEPGAWRRPAIDASALAFLQYTSGSTGAPKGVMLSHGNLLANSAAIQANFAVRDDSVVVIWLPPYHDMGLIGGILQPLYAGCRVVLLSPLDFLARPIRWLRAISHYRGTVSGGPNFAYDLCARKITDDERATLDLSSWEVAFNGAEPIRPATLARFARTFAAQGFRSSAFHPCYGLAEATLLVTGRTPGEAATVKEVSRAALARGRAQPAADPADAHALAGSGRAIADETLVIVDPERHTTRADGELGEIWIAGPHVARGYWAQPEASERTFAARLADGRGPFLRTGDLGFLADGELFVVGRVKDLIIVRGRNLYPQDLELSVEASHRAIRPGCVAALALAEDDEERVVIVAEVDARAAADPDELLGAVRQALVRDHEVAPGTIVLVRAGAIPKTSSGKLQRAACGAALAGGQLEVIAQWRPAAAAAHADADWPALRGALDEREAWLLERIATLAGQWPPQALDRAAPVAAVLDSLQALELQHAIEAELGRSISLAALLGAPDLTALAALLGAADAAASPIAEAAEPAATAPLSHGQRAMWLMERMAPDTGIYHIAGAARVHGALDPAALERALARLVARQPSLRTTVELAGDEPRLRIADRGAITVEIVDGDAAPSARELTDAANRRFDLATGPLGRVRLWRAAGAPCVLLLVLHHLIADLWSVSVLLDELARLYVEETGGAPARLAALPTSFAAHVAAHGQALDGPRGAALRAFWQQRLARPLDPVELPIDGARPREPRFTGASVAFALDPALTAGLRQLARGEGTTLYVAMLAALFALLHRYTGQTDLIIGSPTTGRDRAAVRDLIGYFVNLVPIRGDLSGAPSFRDLVTQLRATTAAALAHADLPFPQLVEWVAPPRDPSRPLLVQVSFALHRAPHEQPGLAGFALRRAGARLPFGPLVLESIALETRATPFELELHVADAGDGLIGRFDYHTDLLSRGAVERLAGHLEVLLRHVVAAPARPIADLPIITGAELAALVPPPRPAAWLGRSAVAIFADRVRAHPDAIAVSQDGRALTYGELDARANQLAHRLRADGIGRGQVVGVVVPRSLELVIALVAIAKAGAAYLCLDHDYPEERLAFMLADSRPRLVITRAALRDRLAASGARCLCLDEESGAIAGQPTTAPDVACTADDLFYVMYTSGSTGQPKGILVHHQSVVGAILADGPLPFADGLVTLAHSPMSWDVPIHEIWGALLGGGRCVLYPAEAAMEIDCLAELARREGVTAMLLTPALFHTMLDIAADALAPVRHLLVGGDAVSVSHMRRGVAALPTTRIVHGYGPAECTMVSTCHVLTAPPAADAAVVPIGHDCADKVTYLLDARLQLVPLGVVGEIYIGGPSVARGYVNNPRLTAARFVPDGLSGQPGARMYRTGDFARRRADGALEFVGRGDQQVKLRGVRIELGEIEAALESLPEVRDAAVVLHGALGSERSLIAYVVAPDGHHLDAAHVRRELARRLPAVMVPSQVVALEAMPLTPNAKVDRRRLAALPVARRSADDAAALTTDTERALAEIWCALLELAAVGPSANFFAEGGNSLLLARLSVRIRDTFAVELPLAVMFQSESLAELARAIDDRKGQRKRGLPPVRRASRDGLVIEAPAKKPI